ncbi:uncharacterized protein [Leuresthes tenuis]|uniref:uncharacterized protein n=1 Tax=Leuresthes tenuis TaxID=355514 RepID=UPI003B5042C3
MILMGRSLCLPSPVTVQELFSVAQDANIVPDISLDPVLTTFLSLDSSAALQHQYAFLQRSMSREQRTAFSLNLTGELGGNKVTYGGVGVIALALSMLFDQVSQQVRAQGSTEDHLSTQRSKYKRIFGISTSSRIGWIIHNYLHLIPGIANNQEKMAETTELYDGWLKLELLDHYKRMTTKRRMSTESMQQWLAGAAIHLHIRIHQVRLHSVPKGSAESLRLSYKTSLDHLVQGYRTYLRRNVQETEALRPRKPSYGTARGPRQTNISSIINMSCSNSLPFNVTLVSQAHKVNDSNTPSSTAGDNRGCKTDGSREDFELHQVRGNNDTIKAAGNRKPLNGSTGNSREEDDSKLGLLVIEPQRNVSHNVQHHPCQSPAIQQALVNRIMNAQDLELNRNFFLHPGTIFHILLKQRDDFELRAN